MSKQSRRRRRDRTRDRVPAGVVIECECGQRLADLYSYGDEPRTKQSRGVDGVHFVRFAPAAKIDQGPGYPKLKDLINEDWWEVRCPRCKSVERGRWPEIRRLVQHAERLQARRVSIERRHEFKSTAPPRQAEATHTPSREW